MKRVLLLNNVPAPYFTPLFEKVGMESGWELIVCYSSAWNQDVGWRARTVESGAAHRTIILDALKPGLKSRLGSSIAAAIALIGIVIQQRPDYLICYGYTLWPQISLLVLAMFTRTPFAISGDANYYNDQAVGAKRLVKSAWLRLVTWRATALIAVGTASRMFWESYGARASQIFSAGFAVDNDFYARACAQRGAQATSLRARLELNDKVVFLFVGRLVKRKNVDLIIRALRQVADPKIALVIAGSGEQREALERLSGGDPRVIFAGNVAPDELPDFYGMADVLALPARQEPWGLVINEAMACGLAIIAHRYCGAAVDLVNENNGVKLNGFEVEEMSDAIMLIAGDEARLRLMQACSRERIKAWSIKAASYGIIRAVEQLGVGAGQRGPSDHREKPDFSDSAVSNR